MSLAHPVLFRSRSCWMRNRIFELVILLLFSPESLFMPLEWFRNVWKESEQITELGWQQLPRHRTKVHMLQIECSHRLLYIIMYCIYISARRHRKILLTIFYTKFSSSFFSQTFFCVCQIIQYFAACPDYVLYQKFTTYVLRILWCPIVAFNLLKSTQWSSHNSL